MTRVVWAAETDGAASSPQEVGLSDLFLPDPTLVSGTIFSAADVVHASEVWSELRTRYAPGWRSTSETVLGRMLTTAAQPAVCEAIALAWSLNVVAGALTEKSVPIFEKKVTGLFSERSEAQFDERRTELAVAEVLAVRVSPLAFEPYVPESAGDPPPSADYAISLPEGVVAIDVTVVHVEAFEAWEGVVRELRNGLQRKIRGAGKFVALELEMPFEFDRTAAQTLLERRTLAPILKDERGELSVDVGGHVDAELRWSPLPIFDSTERLESLPPPTFAAIRAPIGTLGSGGAFRNRPLGTAADVERLAYTSLKRTLQRKKKQFEDKSEPSLVVLKSAHRWLPPGGLIDLIERRVWPNSQFEWLTAAGVFVPRETFSAGAPTSEQRLISTVNEFARVAVTPSLRSLLAGEQAFHLRDGRFEAS
jgi:hypothetical protein